MDAVTCRFGRRQALDQLTLQVPTGQVLAVVGPNGAGKTTLINAICGLIRLQRGQIRVFGMDVGRQPRAVRKLIGVLPQETALYEEITARQNLRFAAALYDVQEAKRRIGEALEIVGLTARGDDVVHTLSGGMQRRLAIARALIHDPALLILDEPTLGVDVEARHELWSHIRELRRQGRTVLLTTNYLDEAEALCDRVAILRSGRLLADDTPAALVARAGRCLDLEVATDAADRMEEGLRRNPAVIRVQRTETGLLLYMNGHGTAEALVKDAVEIAPIQSFRMRSPDLVEVFRALGEAPAA